MKKINIMPMPLDGEGNHKKTIDRQTGKVSVRIDYQIANKIYSAVFENNVFYSSYAFCAN